jgi:hypothetical protein
VNDIAGSTGPETDEDIEGYLSSMAELAAASGIKVILSSVLPVSDYHAAEGAVPQTTTRPMTRVKAVNAWIKTYASEHGHTYLDYFSAMADEKGLLRAELSEDDLHPTREEIRDHGAAGRGGHRAGAREALVAFQPQAGDPCEVAHVAGHQWRVVQDGGGRDEQVHGVNRSARGAQAREQPAVRRREAMVRIADEESLAQLLDAPQLAPRRPGRAGARRQLAHDVHARCKILILLKRFQV